MYAKLKDLVLEPDPSTLPGRPESFALLAGMVVGPPDSRGEELFDVTVCSPEWLAARCREVGVYDARHHLVVNVENFDKGELRRWLESRVQSVQAGTWAEKADHVVGLLVVAIARTRSPCLLVVSPVNHGRR